jgi:5-methyltetrahydropteroyltriglutamate--homocysteine methyltransferase
MTPIPTEPIGSIPRPTGLIAAFKAFAQGMLQEDDLEAYYDSAVKDTVERFAATGSPIITDGEQRKYDNYWTYPIHGLPNLQPRGYVMPFVNGHSVHMPRLLSGPFRYKTYAHSHIERARRHTRLPLKQAVIAPSALSLLYPAEDLPNYPRETFLVDLLLESETDIRRCFAAGAENVQIDFTEGRLAVRLDPTGAMLHDCIELNNILLEQFTSDERSRLGIHTCPGGDCGSSRDAAADYNELLPSLFELQVGRFYIQLASEDDRARTLKIVRAHIKPHQRVFVGVVDPGDPNIETPQIVRDRILEAARHIPADQLGTTDDCGFSPFCDEVTISRDTAFAKIKARVEGTALAERALNGD